MYTCSKCGEILGDNVVTCFNCKNTIPVKEVEKHIEKHIEKQIEVKETKCVTDEEKRRTYTNNLLLYNAIAIPVYCTILWALVSDGLTISETGNTAVILLFLMLAFDFFVKYHLKINICPFCGTFIFFSYGKRHCSNCGAWYK